MFHLIAVGLAYLLDKWIGDPRWLPHPVVGIGKIIHILDRKLNQGRGKKGKGMLLVAQVLVVVAFITVSLLVIAYTIHPFLGVLVEAFIMATTIATKGLREAAEQVAVPLKNQDLPEARRYLSYIVGRDTDQLNEHDLARGAIETVAENTSDGVTAPLFYGLIGGAPLAMIYRAINTCDSMLGYKNERYAQFGWAAARLDDLANLIPSRLTGVLMVFVNAQICKKKLGDCFNVLFRDAPKHPSPNSGWGEAAMAALLNITLGGRNTYKGMVSYRAKMGDGKERLDAGKIEEAITIMERTVFSFVLLLFVTGGVWIVIT
nr:adenosylcobinamide-phosphate synthase CbiB [Halalkalibacterium ligniniphilum]